MMKPFTFAALAMAAVLGMCSSAHAVPILIDFEGGTIGNPVGGFYSGLGVTFSNGQFISSLGLPGTSGAISLGTVSDPVNPPYNPGPTSQIIATFSSAVSLVSIVGIDVGADGVRIEAYDALVGGSLVDFDQFFGIGAGVGNFGTLSVSGLGILRVEIFQPLNVVGAGDGVLFDNFQFEIQAVPEPASLALWGLGSCIGLIAVRRRAKTKKLAV